MDQAAITAAVQRDCRNPRLSSTDITAMTLRGVSFLGMHVKQADPSFYLKTKSITSNTHVFAKPSDCYRIEKVWDMGTNGKAVSGAADHGDGTIDLTITAHGFTSNDIINVHDIVGTTEANAVWKITSVDANTVTLIGSTYANAYTSGGRAYVIPLNPEPIEKIVLRDATNYNPNHWYPHGSNIVVDDKTFTNDIIIDYEKTTSSITDIDASFHEGLVSFCVVQLIRIPAPKDPTYKDLVEQKRFHQSTLDFIISEIYRNLKATSEPTQMFNHWRE